MVLLTLSFLKEDFFLEANGNSQFEPKQCSHYGAVLMLHALGYVLENGLLADPTNRRKHAFRINKEDWFT